jgi:anti-anti-sigma factor
LRATGLVRLTKCRRAEKGEVMAVTDRRLSASAGCETPPLEVREVVFEGTRTLVLSGELDMSSAVHLENAILAGVADVSGLTLDLSQLTFMDSTGLRLILFARQLCEGTAEFSLVPGPRQVQRIFELTNLLDQLPFHEP